MTGFVLLDKPQGLTSFAACARCRRLFQTKKGGHTGTLDPMATGVLVVALGGATRFIDLLEEKDKAYRAVFRLGETTDTLDSSGTVLQRFPVTCGKAQVEEALSSFRGTLMQTPPMYSALKQSGVRLYALARQGIEVERPARPVTVHKIELADADEENNTYTIDVACSAGTYIRSLVFDLGEMLGTGAVLTALRRTMANGQPIERCHTLPELEAMAEQGTLDGSLLPIETLLSFEQLTVTEAQARRFSNGGELDLCRLQRPLSGGVYSVFAPDGTFLGVGKADTQAGALTAKKILGRP